MREREKGKTCVERAKEIVEYGKKNALRKDCGKTEEGGITKVV